MRTCSVCSLEKSLDSFPKASITNGKQYFRSLCKPCYSLKQIPVSKEYRVVNKEAVSKYHRSNKLKTRYGISLEEYTRLYLEQEGKCKICNTSDTRPNTNFAVDHCHTTGTVRGLLCSNCNMAIGLLKDNITVLKSAIDYLTNEKQKRKK